MAILTSGALLIDRKTRDGGPDVNLEGFLSLIWHGAHTNEGGQGRHADVYSIVNIARNVKGGQFDIRFCSTKCLRSFFNHAVDSLEKKLSKK